MGRLTRETPFLCEFSFPNDLPDVADDVAGPRLPVESGPAATARVLAYYPWKAEAASGLRDLVDEGVDIARLVPTPLLRPDHYPIPAPGAPPAPLTDLDRALLDAARAAVAAAGGATGVDPPARAEVDEKVERVLGKRAAAVASRAWAQPDAANLGRAAWLVKPAYASGHVAGESGRGRARAGGGDGASATAASARRVQETLDAALADPDAWIRETFIQSVAPDCVRGEDGTWVPNPRRAALRHPTRPDLVPVSVLPVVPDLSGRELSLLRYVGGAPTRTARATERLPPSERDWLARASVLKASTIPLEGGEGAEDNLKFSMLLVPRHAAPSAAATPAAAPRRRPPGALRGRDDAADVADDAADADAAAQGENAVPMRWLAEFTEPKPVGDVRAITTVLEERPDRLVYVPLKASEVQVTQRLPVDKEILLEDLRSELVTLIDTTCVESTDHDKVVGRASRHRARLFGDGPPAELGGGGGWTAFNRGETAFGRVRTS